jgi:hypothetical protein
VARLLDGGFMITVDSLSPSVDSTSPTADGGILPGFLIDLTEPAQRGITVDTAFYSADETIWPTADGGILGGAADVFDARVIAASKFGLVFKPAAIVGVGLGILPRLLGEAHGIVILAGSGAAVLPIGGAAVGEVEQTFPSDDEILMMLLAA